ncbi:MAG TPA: fatty acid cis/trans isomerase [Burkholderiaceae bacterium]|nr:fatty acid cis/trans isomerase [Burkholderiaceae bacterium]
MRFSILGLLITLLLGCATLVSDVQEVRFGKANIERFDRPVAAREGVPSYQQHIKPILDNRCVVCHGCYDAPCQLKMSSWDGIARGLSKSTVYGDLRMHETPLTRLGIDADFASQWRGLGFHPVLNERIATTENNLAASVLWKSIELKQTHPLPNQPVLSNKDFDFNLNRAQSCPNLGEYDDHAQQQPLAGMPYGFPGLNNHDREQIRRWLEAGAPDDPAPAMLNAISKQVAQWETFLNGDSNKEQLMARYLYEHLFLGKLMFEGDKQAHIFRLVRSRTQPGQAIQQIASRRPFDDPGVKRPYYRLVLERETVLAKTHMPFVLSRARMERWHDSFLNASYSIPQMPGYSSDIASNPFKTFANLPLNARYQFLLDDASYFVSNFIKGPVCRGQTALNVIRDHFWVFFVDPKMGANDDAASLVAREAEVLRMPAAQGSNANLLNWRSVAADEDRLLMVKSKHMERIFGSHGKPINQNFIWNGDGHNQNAALTIFRHFDSATVEQGLLGDTPKTAWVLGYPSLERIFYLLVAGFDVYGNTAHQLQTRLAMDFLRMEGEANFLMLLPQRERLRLRDEWYLGASDEVKGRVLGGVYRFDAESGIQFPQGSDPQQHLYTLLQQRLAPVLNKRHVINTRNEPDSKVRQLLSQLAMARGAALQWLPEATILRIDTTQKADGGHDARYYSLLRNVAHSNVSTLFSESATLIPNEYTLTVVPGIVGAYPNALLHANALQLPELVQMIADLKSNADYTKMANRFAIRRTNPDFWVSSDAMMTAYRRWDSQETGILDLSRFDNR